MLAGKELTKLEIQRHALVLESSLNRLKVQLEFQKLRASTADLADAGRRRAPLLLGLAPIAGFFFGRGSGGGGNGKTSWLGRIMALAKLIGPALTLWRTFSSARKAPPAPESP